MTRFGRALLYVLYTQKNKPVHFTTVVLPVDNGPFRC
jgi:hypothetical protein